MNKLEKALIELETMVDIGICTLANKQTLDEFMDAHGWDEFDMLERIELSTIGEYLSNVYNIGDIYDLDEIKEYITDYLNVDDIFDDDEIRQYAMENCDLVDYEMVYEFAEDNAYDVLEHISNDAIIEYCQENLVPTDVYGEDDILERVGEEYGVADVFDDDVVKDYVLANEDIRKEVLYSMPIEWLQDFISHNFALADFIEWI